MNQTFTVDAIYEDGVLRPVSPIPLSAGRRVTITVDVRGVRPWPADVAAIYQELGEEDRRLAAAMLPLIKETLPKMEPTT